MAARSGHATGATTIGAAGGGGVGAGLGAALADVLVEFVPRMEEVEGSVALIFAAALAYLGAILGGKFSPSSEKHVTPAEGELPVSPQPDFVVVDPEDVGHGGPSLEESGLVDSPASEPEPGAGSAPLPVPEDEDERSGSMRA